MFSPNLARRRPAAPPGAPTRPARGMSGFWIRQVHAYQRAAYTSEPMNAEAPIWAAYRLCD